MIWFNIGSVEAFERNLENAQLEMNIEPANFVSVIYKTEAEVYVGITFTVTVCAIVVVMPSVSLSLSVSLFWSLSRLLAEFRLSQQREI